MIKNPLIYSSFKRLSRGGESLSLEAKYRILESLFDEARHVGRFGAHDLLLGLEDAVRLAAALNANVSRATH